MPLLSKGRLLLSKGRQFLCKQSQQSWSGYAPVWRDGGHIVKCHIVKFVFT